MWAPNPKPCLGVDFYSMERVDQTDLKLEVNEKSPRMPLGCLRGGA